MLLRHTPPLMLADADIFAAAAAAALFYASLFITLDAQPSAMPLHAIFAAAAAVTRRREPLSIFLSCLRFRRCCCRQDADAYFMMLICR